MAKNISIKTQEEQKTINPDWVLNETMLTFIELGTQSEALGLLYHIK